MARAISSVRRFAVIAWRWLFNGSASQRVHGSVIVCEMAFRNHLPFANSGNRDARRCDGNAQIQTKICKTCVGRYGKVQLRDVAQLELRRSRSYSDGSYLKGDSPQAPQAPPLGPIIVAPKRTRRAVGFSAAKNGRADSDPPNPARPFFFSSETDMTFPPDLAICMRGYCA
ncbi:MAG: hypothetical protein AAGJ87_04085 [Pseudomonadota bacterium]